MSLGRQAAMHPRKRQGRRQSLWCTSSRRVLPAQLNTSLRRSRVRCKSSLSLRHGYQYSTNLRMTPMDPSGVLVGQRARKNTHRDSRRSHITQRRGRLRTTKDLTIRPILHMNGVANIHRKGRHPRMDTASMVDMDRLLGRHTVRAAIILKLAPAQVQVLAHSIDIQAVRLAGETIAMTIPRPDLAMAEAATNAAHIGSAS
jgi:hypothetical protein